MITAVERDMSKETLKKIAGLILLLAVVSAKTLIEDNHQAQRLRLFGYLDALIRAIDSVNSKRIDRDTTVASNETISSILHSPWNPQPSNHQLLAILDAYMGSEPLVFNGDALYDNRSPLDPDASSHLTILALTSNTGIPTRIWFTSTSGYGGGIQPAHYFVLLVPDKAFEDIFVSKEPVLLEQGGVDGKIYALSIPLVLRPLLRIWINRPQPLGTFLFESPSNMYPPELIAKGRQLVQLGLSPVVDTMSYDQFRADVIRLASTANDKSYSMNQVADALRDSLVQQQLDFDLFGVKFPRELFALVFPFVYAFAGYWAFQAATSREDPKGMMVPSGPVELSAMIMTFILITISVFPIAWATTRYVSYLTPTGLPQEPSPAKYAFVIVPLTIGFGLLTRGLIKELKRVLFRRNDPATPGPDSHAC